jgi:Ca-activated chloride channel family protein
MGLEFIRAFHFLHPAWLLALPPLLVIALWLAWRQRTAGNWSQVMDPELLAALRLPASGRHRSPWWLIGLAWTAASIALAGPAWHRVQSPAFRSPDNWMLLLDLSPSMASTDVPPDRVTRARYAIDDLLSGARDARVGLIVFAGEAHTVVPLTGDVATLRTLLPPLSPGIMPEAGDQVAPALDEAGRLLQAAGARHGRVIVLTDGFADATQAFPAAQRLRARNFEVQVIGIGHAPDDSLRRLASVGGGRFWFLTQAPQLMRLLQTEGDGPLDQERAESDIRVDVWRNEGFWLLPPLLLVATLLARRGWV